MGRTLAALFLIALAAGATLLLSLPPSPTAPTAAPSPAPGEEAALPRVGSRENLIRLLSRGGHFWPIREKALVQAAQEQAPAAAAAGAEGANYSRTNVQVEGVDEADLVKTDGRYIYRVSRSRVAIIRAYPPEELALVANLELDGNYTPRELYLDGEYLTVIGEGSGLPPEAAKYPGLLPGEPYPRIGWSWTKVSVFDVSDPSAPRKMRELEVEGTYLSSRRLGPYLYLLAQRPVDPGIMEPGSKAPASETPAYRDSARGGDLLFPEYEEVRYFPEFAAPNYLLVAGLDLARPDRPAEVRAYLGGGETVYASLQNLYVALTGYPDPVTQALQAETVIYRFALENGQAVYEARGRVPGKVLNQFSLDEHRGFLRVATTQGEVWASGEAAARNNLYVLDMNLSLVGRLENIAPGERIYAARFLGDRAYLVTFKKVDPFFVLDLSDPTEPRVLGYLKIPGYSDYLHPYDENHVLGFGKDTVESLDPWDPDLAFYQGLKVALFDVRDVAHPVEKFRVVIGDRGTDSELLRNHKALLFSREKNLLAFPVELHEADPASRSRDPLAYAPLTFQGLYVFSLDPDRGFHLRGRVSHLGEEDLRPYADLPVAPGSDPGERWVERGLYIGDVLYVLSPTVVTAHNLEDLAPRGRLEFSTSDSLRSEPERR